LRLDIIKLSKTITDQNSFQFLDKTYLQTESLAIGAPTSSISSEFYLQYLENTEVYKLLLKRSIEGYFRYVNNILIIYNMTRSNTNDVLDDFNKLLPKLKFSVEEEIDHKINFLDITIHRKRNNLSVDIYRKPSTTDVIKPNDSCHPREHKMAAIHYFHNRMNTYKSSHDSIQKEINTIQQILTDNK